MSRIRLGVAARERESAARGLDARRGHLRERGLASEKYMQRAPARIVGGVDDRGHGEAASLYPVIFACAPNHTVENASCVTTRTPTGISRIRASG